MKLTLDIKDESRIPFFLELISGLSYVEIIKQDYSRHKQEAFLSQMKEDLQASFNEIRLQKEGKIKLKSAKEFLNELSSNTD